MSYDFSTTSHAKWILAGEHSVLRGNPALVFPLSAFTLRLDYQREGGGLSAEFSGSNGADIQLLFWSVLEHGLASLSRSINELSGQFFLTNAIPIGAGMGASAALCVAIARWFVWMQWIKAEECLTFAQDLEDLFHGKSSGLDILGADAKTGHWFKQGRREAIEQTWAPHWYLSFCGQIGITAHCVSRVNDLWAKDESRAQAIDDQMNRAVGEALSALKKPGSHESLIDSVNTAYGCFKAWGLVSDTMESHLVSLKQDGALAVKPTGSGEGGYVLSVWDKEPRAASIEHFKLIKA